MTSSSGIREVWAPIDFHGKPVLQAGITSISKLNHEQLVNELAKECRWFYMVMRLHGWSGSPTKEGREASALSEDSTRGDTAKLWSTVLIRALLSSTHKYYIPTLFVAFIIDCSRLCSSQGDSEYSWDVMIVSVRTIFCCAGGRIAGKNKVSSLKFEACWRNKLLCLWRRVEPNIAFEFGSSTKTLW